MRGLSLLSVNPLSRTSLPGGGVTLGALALVFWVIGLTMASIGHIHNLGLITVLGWPYFVALALLSLGVVLELQRDELAPRRLIALIAAFVVVLFGTSSALVPVATITDSYIHMGFVGYIAHHGHVLNNYDARFSWPGAFALAASVLAFTGQSSALVFLRWFPVVIELAYLAPLLVIARKSGVSKRASYLGIVFFYVGNWIYQDYFSPQALNFFFFLVVVATVLSLWSPLTSAPSERSLAARWNATLRSLRPVRWGGHETVASFGAARTLILSAAVMIIVWASTVSHQLTPYLIVLALGGLLLTRRLGRPEMVVGAAVLTWAWISLGASAFWAGSLSRIFGSFGHVSASLNANVASRVVGSSSHHFIVETRIASIAVLFVLAVVGALRRSTDDRALEFLTAAPFLTLVAQSYGGEALLRATLFALPFAGLLAASAFAPRADGSIAAWITSGQARQWPRAASTAGLAFVVLAFAIVFTLDRGGNDDYQAYTRGELNATNYVYDHIAPGQTMGLEAPFLPVGQTGLSVDVDYASNGSGMSVTKLASRLLRLNAPYVVLTTSQERWGVVVEGYPIGWQRQVRADLLNDGYTVVAHWPTATVYQKN